MFGTDGVRGVANLGPMSPELVLALGRAAVRVLVPSTTSTSKPYFVIGRDTRLSGSMLEAALTAGICSAGANVLKVGVLPTPGVAYLTRAMGSAAGVMISASHNPYMDNGVKFFSAQGRKLEDRLEGEIEKQIHEASNGDRPTGKAIGETQYCEEPEQRYINFLRATYHQEKPFSLRIGLDCANGAASHVAPALFTQLGAQVYVWHSSPDGLNINEQCGALYPEFLQQKVVDERLDLGFAFDGDADRLIAIDHTGRILDGDYILAICSKALLASDVALGPVVVSTVMANLGLERALQQMGLELHKTQVGDRHVVQAMQRRGAVLGGEQSGHIVFLQYHTTGDGLLTAIQLLNAVMSQRASLAELAQSFYKFPQVLLNVKVLDRIDPMTIPAVQEVIQHVEGMLGNDGRVLVRLSGTESVARVMVEGRDEAVITPLAQRIAQTIAHELGHLLSSTDNVELRSCL
jgi:phosphoglucosamine mutase